ncbi:MAG: hypothetical protein AAGC60_29270 [Acidobacteriota bacterium]
MRVRSRLSITLAVLAAVALLAAPAMAGKGEADPAAISQGGQDASGGPDMFGYTFFDQDEPECTFSFIDISGTGTPLSYTASGTFPAEDDGGATVTLAEPFSFYGTSVTDVVVSSNGYIAMNTTGGLADDSGGDFSEDCPLPAAPDNAPSIPFRLMPYHNDLAGDGTGGTTFVEYFAACPRVSEAGDESCTIVHWNNWGFFGVTGSFDLQAVLYHASGLIVYQVSDPAGLADGSSTAVAIQNDAATDSLVYSCDAAGAVADGTAVCIYNPACPTPDCLEPFNPIEVPTQGTLGLVLLGLLLAAGGVWLVRRSA